VYLKTEHRIRQSRTLRRRPRRRRKLAFLFRYIPVNERQLGRAAREAHSGVPFPLHLGKRTPVARV